MLLEHHFVCMHISITLISRVTDGEIQRTKQEKEGEGAHFNCTLHGFSFGLFRLIPGSVRKCYGVATSCCGYVFVDSIFFFYCFLLCFFLVPGLWIVCFYVTRYHIAFTRDLAGESCYISMDLVGWNGTE